MAKRLLFFCFLFIPRMLPGEVLLTEVAPSIPNGDFVELFSSEKVNLSRYQLLEGSKVIKTFPNVTLNFGPFASYILLHTSAKISENNVDDSDWAGDLNQDGVVDLYSEESSPGLTGGACNSLTLKSANGKIIDFVSWAVTLDPYPKALQEPYVQSVSSGIWFPVCNLGQTSCFQAGSIPWNNKTTQSFSRKLGPNGMPLQFFPSTAQDWQLGNISPGEGYSKSIVPKDSLLEIFQSPFSPWDGPYREALISYKVLAQTTVSLAIFNLQGNLIRTLLEETAVPSDGIHVLSWDGKDNDGTIAEVGMYLVQILNQENSEIKKELKPVCIARKL